tara:strand:- start:13609 stop:14379 length:771 start_codon:yes stop_codon:yes gene_type:complete
MAKILINKTKKEFVEDLNREVTVRKGEMYVIKDEKQDFHTNHGIIAKKDLKKNGIVNSSTKKEFSLFDADFIDMYKQIERSAQIPLLKDIVSVIAFTGLGKKSVVLDAGAGSGGMSLFLANYAKEVVTYDVDKDAVKLVKKNAKMLGLNNVKVKEGDIYRGVAEKDIDVVTLDVPNPWNALGTADKALKVGGFLVVYVPQLTQSKDFVSAVNNHPNFIAFKTAEMLERTWDLDGRKCRPNSRVQHTGFLTFVRKIR